MKLTDSERLILAMLAEIHKALKIKDGFDPDFILQAITSGQSWSLDWQYGGSVIGVDEVPDQVVTETCDILDAWFIIESSYAQLDDTEKQRVDAADFNSAPHFLGFDGNHEPHIGVARHLIEVMGRFQHFAGRDLNSHSPSVESNRRLAIRFGEIRKNLGSRNLTADEIIELLEARRP